MANDNILPFPPNNYLPVPQNNGEVGVPQVLKNDCEYLRQMAEQEGLQLVMNLRYNGDDFIDLFDPNHQLVDHWCVGEVTFGDGTRVGIMRQNGIWRVFCFNPPAINGYPSFPALGYPQAFSDFNMEDLIGEVMRLCNLYVQYGSLAAANDALGN